ncbi:MAG: bifunctional riboflavin kinase/FAD synthetase [Flavobacteriales bacterium]|nr:bifunctional riboflavin kinase/FAD synthetase [Flavobacteriales bacterium]MCC6938887.1 bifunctional riboflavin kinase/FAD synthetase [Flavobacteriales bacterium]
MDGRPNGVEKLARWISLEHCLGSHSRRTRPLRPLKIHTDIAELHGVKRPVLTTGTFDGVHRGHRTIVDRLTEVARKEGGESMLFTFHPHPRMVLYPADNDLKLLNTQEEKRALLEAAGLDHLLVVPFSRQFSRMHAVDYIRDVLVDAIGVHAVVIGYDHRFGRNREGDLSLIRQLGEVYDIQVEEIPAQEVDHVKVSSTKIRNALTEGDIRAANDLLGYHYPLSGVVVKGDQLGRTIGFPTANIGAMDTYKLVPGDGVYAVDVSLREGNFQGMLYIGPRPTVAGSQHRSVEVNIFGLDRDLYGEAITVRFLDRIRGDQRFDGMDALREQLHKDRAMVLERMKGSGTR